MSKRQKGKNMARAKKDPNAAPTPKMSVEDKVGLLRAAAKSDKVIAAALGAVEQLFEEWESSKAATKRAARKLRKLISGLTSGD